jgi:hypothetical protein
MSYSDILFISGVCNLPFCSLTVALSLPRSKPERDNFVQAVM